MSEERGEGRGETGADDRQLLDDLTVLNQPVAPPPQAGEQRTQQDSDRGGGISELAAIHQGTPILADRVVPAAPDDGAAARSNANAAPDDFGRNRALDAIENAKPGDPEMWTREEPLNFQRDPSAQNDPAPAPVQQPAEELPREAIERPREEGGRPEAAAEAPAEEAIAQVAEETEETESAEIEIAQRPVVGDGVTMSVKPAVGDEDTDVPLDINISVVDAYDTVGLITIKGLPDGFTLTKGVKNADGSWTLQPGDEKSVAVRAPEDYSGTLTLEVSAYSTEGGSQSSTTTMPLNVTFTAVADAPEVTATPAQGVEDIYTALNLAALRTDTDSPVYPGDAGPENLTSFVIEGVPAGTSFAVSDGNGGFTAVGTALGGGSWSFTSADFPNLYIRASAHSDDDLALTVKVTATESSNGSQATTTIPLNVNVRAVTDAPTLTATASEASVEDTATPLHISAAWVDNDGSEIQGLTVSGIPSGAVLADKDGALTVTNGVANLMGRDLASLKITPPLNDTSAINLLVTATAQDQRNGALLDTRTAPIAITFDPRTDGPTLAPTAAEVNEDSVIALSVNAGLIDASETLSVTISAIPAGAILRSGTEVLNAGGETSVVVPAGKIAALTIQPPAHSDADFVLKVTATAQDGSDVAVNSAQMDLPVTVRAVTDAPVLTATATEAGTEDTAQALHIDASWADNDGSEVHTLSLSGIPTGAVLADKDGVLTVTNGVANLMGRDLASLKITPPANDTTTLNLTVTATAQDQADGAVLETRTAPITVSFTAVSDTPTLNPTAATVNEDSVVALNVGAALADASETLSVTISAIPAGAILRSGTEVLNAGGETSVLVAADKIAGLTIQPPAHSDVDFTLQITAHSKDGSAATADSATLPLPVTVRAVTDAPVLTATATEAGTEDTAQALHIDASWADNDGSEVHTLSLSGIPTGAVLADKDGVLTVTNGVANLMGRDFASLTIKPPANDTTTLNLTVTATAKDQADGAVLETRTAPITVSFTAVSDTPSLNPSTATVNEDSVVALNVGAALTDASETLSVTISAIPAGAILRSGTEVLNAGGETSVLVPAGKIAGLTIQPPAHSDVDFTLQVTAHSKDGSAATADSATLPLPVTVRAVTDAAVLSATAAEAGVEDTAQALHISASWADNDGSEVHMLSLSGIPTGAVLADKDGAITVTNGVANLVGRDLASLQITPPANDTTTLNLTVTATAKDQADGAVLETRTAPITVTFAGRTDGATLNPTAATGNEDSAIPLTLNAGLVDSSETLTVTLSAIPTGAVLRSDSTILNPNGETSVTVPSGQVAGLTIQPPANSDADFVLKVTATAKDGSDVALTTAQMDLPVTVKAVTDAPVLSATATEQGIEDTAQALHISASWADNDGSEVHTLSLSGIPTGAVLADKDGAITVTNGVADLMGRDLASLKITPPTNDTSTLNLTVTATSKDLADGAVLETRTAPITVNFTGVSDTPTLGVSAASGLEDNLIPLNVTAALTDTSETLSVVISAIPSGAKLYSGATLLNPGGQTSVTVTASQIAGLAIQPPAQSDVDFSLTVVARSQDGSSTIASSAPITLPVTVQAVTDAPVLSATSTASGNEDAKIGLTISSTWADTDGSETQTLTLSGIPTGATLTDKNGTVTVTNGIADIKGRDLATLKVQAPSNFSGKIDLLVTATSQDREGAQLETRTAPITVSVNPQADSAVVGNVNATVDEDNQVSLAPTITLTDTDGSETIAAAISGANYLVIRSTDSDAGDAAWLLNGQALTRTSTTINGTPGWEWRVPMTALNVVQTNAGGAATGWQIAGLEVKPAAQSGRDIDFQLVVGTQDSAAGLTSNAKYSQVFDGKVTVNAVVDELTPTASATPGHEDQAIQLQLGIGRPDLDGSETATAVLRDVPAEWNVMIAGKLATKSGADWVLDLAKLDQVTIVGPKDRALPSTEIHFIVTNKDVDADTGAVVGTKSYDVPLTIIADPVADLPYLVAKDVKGDEDRWIALDLRLAETDVDGSESLTLHIEGGADLSFSLDGTNAIGTYANGVWTFDSTVTPSIVANPTALKVKAPGNSDVNLTLKISLRSDDGADHIETAQQTIYVDVRGVADTPNVVIDGVATPLVNNGTVATAGTEDVVTNLNLNRLQLSDTDGSERLSVTISTAQLPSGFKLILDLPSGFTVPSGYASDLVYAGNNKWRVDEPLLPYVKLVGTHDYSGTVNLPMDVVVTEREGDVLVTKSTLAVNIAPVTDIPEVSISASGSEDQAGGVPLRITATPEDLSNGVETITQIKISGLPATLTLKDNLGNVIAPDSGTAANPTYTFTGSAVSKAANLYVTGFAEDQKGSWPLSVAVTAKDGTATEYTRTLSPNLTVAAVADAPDMTGDSYANGAHGVTSASIPLDIAAVSPDDFNTEAVSYTITGVPKGVVLSVGDNLGDDGSGNGTCIWVIKSGTDIGSLTLSVPYPAGVSGHFAAVSSGFAVTVTATDTEASNGSRASTTLPVTVTWDTTVGGGDGNGDGIVDGTSTVIPLAQSASVTAPATVSGAEAAGSIAVPITVSQTDTDGTLSTDKTAIAITNLPSGWSINVGSYNPIKGWWIVDQADLANLRVTPGGDFSGEFALAYRTVVTESESGDVWESASAQVLFRVTPTDDGVSTTVVGSTSATEDTGIDIVIRVTAGDASEVADSLVVDSATHGTVSSVTNNGDGTWTVHFVPAANYSGDAVINYTVASHDSATINGATVTSAGTTRSFSVPVSVASVPDTPSFTAQAAATGNEDGAIGLSITATSPQGLFDTDGSEVLSFVISGLPTGAVLNKGANNGDGSWTLTKDELSGLTITPPRDFTGSFDISVKALAVEKDTQASASSTTQTITVTANAVADRPLTDPTNLTVSEDGSVALNLALTSGELNASATSPETLGALISGVPAGGGFKVAGVAVGTLVSTANGVETWRFAPSEIAGLTYHPKTDLAGSYALTVTPEAFQGTSTTQGGSAPMTLTINAVSDAPAITVATAQGNEDTVIPLSISVAQGDTDGSETLGSVTISGIPTGAKIFDGATELAQSGNAVSVTVAQLANLKIQPPANSDADFALTVTTTSKDGAAASATTTVQVNVQVDPVSDLPVAFTVPAASGNEDALITINMPQLSWPDNDGSETHWVTIGGIPSGSVLKLSGATIAVDGNGTATLDATQLASINATTNPLKIQAPVDFSGSITLGVVAHSQDGSAAVAHSATTNVAVTVNAVADTPSLTVHDASGTWGTPIALDLSSAATDSSETLSLNITGVPGTATLSAGTKNANGSWTLAAGDLNNLTLTPQDGVAGNYTLSVTATSKEASNSSTATANKSLTLSVAAPAPIEGSAGDDVLNGTALSEVLKGLDGNDTIHAGAGSDTIHGGAGSDTLFGDNGDDLFVFNAGDQTHAVGDALADFVYGGAGTDTVDLSGMHAQFDLYVNGVQQTIPADTHVFDIVNGTAAEVRVIDGTADGLVIHLDGVEKVTF